VDSVDRIGVFVEGIAVVEEVDEQEGDKATANRHSQTCNVDERGQFVFGQVAVGQLEIGR